jgi:hypothetical protein
MREERSFGFRFCQLLSYSKVDPAPKADVPFQIDYRPKAGLKAICKGTSASSAHTFYDT